MPEKIIEFVSALWQTSDESREAVNIIDMQYSSPSIIPNSLLTPCLASARFRGGSAVVLLILGTALRSA